MLRKFVWILGLLLLSAGPVRATTYNVTDASTLNTALAAVVGDDVINMADGNYNYAASFTVSRSGTSGHPITWQATNYRAATILFSGGGKVRLTGDFWNLKNFVIDGASAYPSSEALLTLGDSTDASKESHNDNIYGLRLRKSGSAGLMIAEGSHDVYISDLHVDGTGYASTNLHGEGVYIGSVGAINVNNVTIEDSLIEDNVENIIDIHPGCTNVTLTRILGRGQTTSAAHGVSGTPTVHQTIEIGAGSSVTFTDITFQNNNAGENVIWCSSSAGTVTFTRLKVNTSTTVASLIDPKGATLTMTASEFWNVNNTTVNASTGSGSQSITTTCGTSKSGTGNSLSCAAPSTPVFWQRQEQVTASGTSAAKAYTLSVTAGSVLTAEVVTAADVSATASASDTVNGAWTYGYNSGGKLNFFYKTNSAAGATTVTFATGAGSTAIRMVIKEHRGVDASTVLASSNSGSGTGGTQGSGNVTTGQNNNLLIQSCGADTPVTLTKDSNFTLRFFNGGDKLLSADRVPVTGTYAATCTQSGSATIRSGIANFGPPTATGTIEIGSISNLNDAATFTIPWSSQQLSGGQTVDIFISRDGGTTYETIVTNTTDDGQYDWTVSGGSTSSAMFKVCGNTSTSICGISNTFRKKGKYL